MNYHRRGYTIRCYYLTDKIPRITCKPNICCKVENDNHKKCYVKWAWTYRKTFLCSEHFFNVSMTHYNKFDETVFLSFIFCIGNVTFTSNNNNSTLLKFNCSLEVQLIKSIKKVDIICKTRTIYDTCFNFHTSLHFNSILTFRSNNLHLF